jgi:MFS family permease
MTAESTTSDSKAWAVFGYFGPLTLLIYLAAPNGYLLDIATSFMLKNQLHATPEQVANFRLLTAIPIYFAFAFGLARDLWNPFGLRDRGLLMIFGAASAAIFVWLSQAPLTYAGLVAGMLLAMVAGSLLGAAHRALMALVGQERQMSGRLSALWNLLWSAPFALGAFISGYVTEHIPPATIFLLVGLLCASLGLFGLWRPQAVFSHAYDQPLARGSSFVGDLRRLVRHRAIYPAVLLVFMFQFGPGLNTPMQYYLTEQLHAGDAAYGNFLAIFQLGLMPAYLLYGALCRRVALKWLLWAGVLISIPQLLPLTVVHSAEAALWLAFPIGLMGGFAFAALCDLTMRSCPPGLQGTLMMTMAGAYELSTRGSDLLGAAIYASSPAHGFLYCALTTSAVYALMVPVLLLVPAELVATADGERNPVVEAEVLAEIGEAAPAAR